MNFERAARAPWVAATGSMRWLAVGIMVASIALAVVLRGTGVDATAVVFSLAPAVGLWWMFFLPNMLVLTLSARKLSLPGVRRDVTAAIGVYVVLTIVAPALLLGLVGADVAAALLILALAASGCMLYATAPAWLAVMAPLAMIAAPHMPSAWMPPAPGTTGFVRWAVAATLVLVLADVLRWSQLQRIAGRQALGVRRAMIFALNNNLRAIVHGDAGIATVPQNDPSVLLRQRPDRLQRQANLRDSGPEHPWRALRIALGGWYLPETLDSRLRRTVMASWPLLFAVLMLLVVGWSLRASHLAAILVGGTDLVLLDLYAALAAAITTLSIMAYLRRMWRQTNTQVPLLALLPGLGDPARARDALLRVALMKPLRMLAIVLAILLGSAWYAGLSASDTAFLALVPILWAGVLIVGITQILGGCGRLEQGIFLWLVCSICGVLTCVSVALPAMAFGALTPGAGLLAWVWLVLVVVLLAMGWRSWQRLRARPHPFLANAQ